MRFNFYKAFKILLVVFLILIATHSFLYFFILTFNIEQPIFQHILKFFDLNGETNFPTMYNAFLLVISAILLFMIAENALLRKETRTWNSLGAIMLYLGMDDFIGIHEKINYYLQQAIHTTGFLYYAWVIPFGIAAIVLAIVFIPFLKRLPDNIRNKFMLAGTIYFLGGIGMELLAGKLISTNSPEVIYILISTIEEIGEMSGILIFIHALGEYIKQNSNTITITFKHPNRKGIPVRKKEAIH